MVEQGFACESTQTCIFISVYLGALCEILRLVSVLLKLFVMAVNFYCGEDDTSFNLVTH